MLPRMRPPTAAPTCAGAASRWPATGATPTWPAGPGRSRPRRPGGRARRAGPPRRAHDRRRGRRARHRTPGVRRRAVEAAPAVRGPGSRSALPGAVTAALADPDPLVVVGAAWFLAERRHRAAVPALVATATGHADTRCREAAVAALGAIGDPAGLAAVLAALGDKPTVGAGPPWPWPASTTPGSSPRCGRRPRTGTGRCARRPTSCSTSRCPRTTRSGRAAGALSRPG